MGREPLETLEAEDSGRMHSTCRGPAVGMGLVIEKQTGVLSHGKSSGRWSEREAGLGCDDPGGQGRSPAPLCVQRDSTRRVEMQLSCAA